MRCSSAATARALGRCARGTARPATRLAVENRYGERIPSAYRRPIVDASDRAALARREPRLARLFNHPTAGPRAPRGDQRLARGEVRRTPRPRLDASVLVAIGASRSRILEVEVYCSLRPTKRRRSDFTLAPTTPGLVEDHASRAPRRRARGNIMSSRPCSEHADVEVCQRRCGRAHQRDEKLQAVPSDAFIVARDPGSGPRALTPTRLHDAAIGVITAAYAGRLESEHHDRSRPREHTRPIARNCGIDNRAVPLPRPEFATTHPRSASFVTRSR